MGWGIDATIWIARWVSSLPGAVQPAPPLPMLGVVQYRVVFPSRSVGGTA
jgi:hypothetical protein